MVGAAPAAVLLLRHQRRERRERREQQRRRQRRRQRRQRRFLVLSPSSFGGPLRHSRPGTLSLALGANDDDDAVRIRPGYRAAEFLITTGPGPVPSLDGANIVFGGVEQGLAEVVGAVTARVRVLGATPGPFGDLARAIGDERVARVTAKYGRPLQLVVITKAGVL